MQIKLFKLNIQIQSVWLQCQTKLNSN